jgi:trehalose 6-phosphate synthase
MTIERKELTKIDYDLIIASNRAPVSFEFDENEQLHAERGSGGLVTALTGLARQTKATWIACALTEGDRTWEKGEIDLYSEGEPVEIKFLSPPQESYEGYYNVIANPLLWFLQHSMWDVPRSPVIDRSTWSAWENGYVAVNQLFANEIAESIRATPQKSLVMLQDYHLYLVAHQLREQLSRRQHFTMEFHLGRVVLRRPAGFSDPPRWAQLHSYLRILSLRFPGEIPPRGCSVPESSHPRS